MSNSVEPAISIALVRSSGTSLMSCLRRSFDTAAGVEVLITAMVSYTVRFSRSPWRAANAARASSGMLSC